MGVEIERKFLLANANWRKISGPGTIIKQGYLNANAERTVRVRVKGDHAFLTIKGRVINTSRPEFEYEIPVADALELLALCEQPLIDKIRYEVVTGPLVWEIDEFKGDNAGLIVAEVELDSENQAISLPEWIGEEVSHDLRYFNSSLIKLPFSAW